VQESSVMKAQPALFVIAVVVSKVSLLLSMSSAIPNLQSVVFRAQMS
jgi:hypothetical protein